MVGIHAFDIVRLKQQKAMNLAKSREYPLLVTIEEE